MKFISLFSFGLLITTSFFFIFNLTYAQTPPEQPVKSTQILQTETTWNGKDIEYPQNGSEEITALEIVFEPGAETSWHRHPVPSLAYVINGELKVILKDSGESKIFKKGDAFAEVIDTWHYGKNIGDEPVKIVVFYIGEKGMLLTELLTEVQEEENDE